MKKESPGDVRQLVLWVGADPSAPMVTEFTNRGLVLQQCGEQHVQRNVPLARAIVFRYSAEHDGLFHAGLTKFGTQALDHGLLLAVVADSDQAFSAMETVLKRITLPGPPVKRLLYTPHETVLAESVARHDPGPPEGHVKIDGERIPDEARLFLCRAFHDCKTITIKRLTRGRSANVFSVHAIFSDSKVGPRPLPFFAKVDKKGKILNEWEKYQNPVGHFIPFQARPDLEPDRCFVGATNGILVGNFVENSESLWDVAKRGVAQPVIYSLFDEALRGWRLQAYAKDDANAFGESLWASMKDLFDLTRSVSSLKTRAKEATAFGAVRPPEEILEALESRGHLRHRVAPCHGDLHVDNVRARRGEAILIDFNSVQISGPLVADPASLEVSIVFESAPKDNDHEGWRTLVESLYAPEYLHRAPPPPKEPALREWMWACVRQIRLIALESQETDREYHYALIWYLLRRASFRDEGDADKYRRDYAYWLACRLTGDLESILGS